MRGIESVPGSSRLGMIYNRIRLSEEAVWRKTNYKIMAPCQFPVFSSFKDQVNVAQPVILLRCSLSSRPGRQFPFSPKLPRLCHFPYTSLSPIVFYSYLTSFTSFLFFHRPLCLNLFPAKSCRDGGLSWRLGAARQAIKKPRRREAGP